jgi:ubiquinone/menaquinone biosynthesis C-methylase UbiE
MTVNASARAADNCDASLFCFLSPLPLGEGRVRVFRSHTMKRYRAIAEYYDAEYADKTMLREDVPFFLAHLPKRSQTILELAVGTARAAIPIAQAGHRVVGVDYAKDMLTIAQRKRDAMGVTDSQLDLRHGDVLRLNLRRRFDWVCLFFNTFLNFTTLAQQDAVLQTVRRHLKPRGRFWLDIFNPDLMLLARRSATDLEPHSFYIPRLQRTVTSVTDVRRDPKTPQLQQISFRYTWFDEAGREHREQNRFSLTYVFPRELQILLERNGLSIEQMYGNYDGSKVTSESPRLIVCCRLSSV